MRLPVTARSPVPGIALTALCVRTPAGWRIAHLNFATCRDDDAA